MKLEISATFSPSLFFLQLLLPRPYWSSPRLLGPVPSLSFPGILTILSFPKGEGRKRKAKSRKGETLTGN